jgi:hypothetical protein
MSGVPDLLRDPRAARRARDALAVLASVMLGNGRPGDAAALLAVLARLPGDTGWARRARCQALLLDDRPAEADQEARALLEEPMPDTARIAVLHLLARAAWRLGRGAEAQAHFAEAVALARTTVIGRAGA